MICQSCGNEEATLCLSCVEENEDPWLPGEKPSEARPDASPESSGTTAQTPEAHAAPSVTAGPTPS